MTTDKDRFYFIVLFFIVITVVAGTVNYLNKSRETENRQQNKEKIELEFNDKKVNL